MADSRQSDVTVDELIQRLSTAVKNNDEKTREEVDEVLKLEDQLNIGDRKAFKKAKRIQCLKAIRLQSLSLLQLLFSKGHVLVEDQLDLNKNQEFICTSIQADFLEGVKYLIENGLKLESKRGNRKWIALFQAVEYGKPQIVDFLLNQQPDHVHSTVDGMTLIGLACKTCNFDVLKLLLNSTKAFDLNEVGGEHLALTPLHWCFENRSTPNLLDFVKILVENGAEINIKDNRKNQTPLLMAADHHFHDVVNYFIENGADLTSSDRNKNTALHYLCKIPETKDSLDCIKRFVEEIKIAKLQILNSKNAVDLTPLYIALMSRNVQVVALLVEAGCDVNVKYPAILSSYDMMKSSQNNNDSFAKLYTDKDDKTPLMLAASLRDLDSIKLLIQHGADINAKDCKGHGILEYCFKSIQSAPYCQTACKDVLEFLKTVGVRFTIEDITEESLESILDHDTVDTLEYLISIGLDIHHIGKNNRNILHLMSENTLKITKIEPYCDEADVNQQDIDGNTPLMYTAIKEIDVHFDSSPINYFLKRGADVNLRNLKGQTPLMIFTAMNDHIILKLLIEAGAEVNIRAKDGRTALQFLEPDYDENCNCTPYLTCLRLLLKNGGSPSLDYKDRHGVTPFQYVLESSCLSIMYHLITQNCSFSLVSNNCKMFYSIYDRDSDKLLEMAKLFYRGGAPRQLILDVFKMDDDDEKKFKTFCRNLRLQELCRRQIRVSIGPGIQEKLQNLNIAPKLIWYICLKYLLPDKLFDINNIADDFSFSCDDTYSDTDDFSSVDTDSDT